MTLAQIRESEKDMLTPADVAPVLGVNPYSINIQARDDPSRLGFPVARIGCRVKIPREGFLAWMEGRAAFAPPVVSDTSGQWAVGSEQ